MKEQEIRQLSEGDMLKDHMGNVYEVIEVEPFIETFEDEMPLLVKLVNQKTSIAPTWSICAASPIEVEDVIAGVSMVEGGTFWLFYNHHDSRLCANYEIEPASKERLVTCEELAKLEAE